MKVLKMLGLVMAATAAMAFAGAGSASADVICKSAPVGGTCSGAHHENGTIVTGTTAAAKLIGPFGAEVICSSTVEGLITNGQVSGSQVIGEITVALFTNCNHECKIVDGAVENRALQLPWRVHVGATGGGNGTMWVERHSSKSGGNDPGVTLTNCKDFPFTIFNGCTYKATESQPGGFAGEGVRLTATGGASPSTTASATLNAGICGNATFSATYSLSPMNMWVASS